MKIYDKAIWQIDGGIPSNLVVNHFKIVFTWLEKHDMLNEIGQEELEEGIDSEASLNEELVTKDGAKFLDKYYDKFLIAIAKDKYGEENSVQELDNIYKIYITDNK